MVASNSKSYGNMSQRRNIRTERYVVVGVVLSGLRNLAENMFQWSFTKLSWQVR